MKAWGVHLVGSVPLANAEAVMRAVSTELRDRIARIPDGETGERSGWTRCQLPVFATNGAFEPVNASASSNAPFRLRPGHTGQLVLQNLGYASAASSSYRVLETLTDSEMLHERTRLQVCLPTPLAVVDHFIDAGDRPVVEPIYEAAMAAEIARLADAVPPNRLAIQWDVAVEMAFWEQDNGRSDFRYHSQTAWFANVKAGITDRLVRLAQMVPADIEVGFHFCYGNRGGVHFLEPENTASIVELANAVFHRVTRPISWVHLPVPLERTDVQYLAPLADLSLTPATELYLGLIHECESAEQTMQRIDTAAAVLDRFGVATECGFGRRDPATIEPLLQRHRDVSRPLSRPLGGS
jgi:methionine synthase II (cobalamin-independent)